MIKVGDEVEYTANSGKVIKAWVLGLAGKTSVYLGPKDGFIDNSKPHRKSTKHLRLVSKG